MENDSRDNRMSRRVEGIQLSGVREPSAERSDPGWWDSSADESYLKWRQVR